MGTPLFTVAELRAIEQGEQRDLPSGELMARAGRGAARRIDELAGARRASICIVAGPGNNGGDGFVTAAELAARGHEVRCVLLGAVQPSTSDAHAACERWRQGGGAVLATLPDVRFGVVVDALFGIGLARPLQDAFLEAARWIDAHAGQVVALDVPSGLDSNRGAWVGDVKGVRADLTVTFLGDKPGLHTGTGIDAAGTVQVDDLGVAARSSALLLAAPDDFPGIALPRRRDTHKGSFGNVLVVGGGRGMVGAPLLAARAALRLGAGRVYVDCVGAPDLRVDLVQPELMFRPHASIADPECVVVGCGLGVDAKARSALSWSLARPHAVVIDADGLNLLADEPSLRTTLRARTASTVLTPHPLEAARLLNISAHAVQSDRIGAARALASDCRALVILKGAGSVIAAPDGRTVINPTGSPALATAGTGDVLAGMLGALIAQGFDAWQAVIAAVWLHGAAVRGAGDIGVTAGELAPRAVAALRGLREHD
ncbi:MAG TPA: NAD(P)H-hydrate dehydratase [Burkholderiaceae bacterium]|nr:NAD(P)H-hydrate dehydratase [Burkholderiaceae bacterium]